MQLVKNKQLTFSEVYVITGFHSLWIAAAFQVNVLKWNNLFNCGNCICLVLTAAFFPSYPKLIIFWVMSQQQPWWHSTCDTGAHRWPGQGSPSAVRWTAGSWLRK